MSHKEVDIVFNVLGKPRPQGSMTPIKSKSTGRMFLKHSKNLAPWRSIISYTASNNDKIKAIGVTEYAMRIFVEARFTRPKKHFRTGRFSGVLRDDAPDKHTAAPDSDKLMRAVMDALEGIAYKNDSQVYDQRLVKRWCLDGEAEGIMVCLRVSMPSA